MKWHAPNVRLFPALTGALAGLAGLLWLASWLGVFATPVTPDLAARETRAPPATPEASVVLVGLSVDRLGPVDTSRETFEASFEVWLVGDEIPSAADLVFPDAVTPIVLGPPVAARETPAQSYARYGVTGTFRYRPKTSDLIAGRAQLDLRLIDAASSTSAVLLLPDRENTSLAQGSGARRPSTSDGLWDITGAYLNVRRVFRPTLGDPLFASASTSNPEISADFFLQRASPDLYQSAQRLMPAALALPALIAAMVLLAAMPALGRLDRSPGPWRTYAVLAALAIALAAAQRVFESDLAPGIGPADARLAITAASAAWLALIAVWVIALMPPLVWRPLEHRWPSSASERMVVNVVIALGFLVYFLAEILDLPLASIGAASGVLTIVLGIALQNIILDLFAGILLNLEKPFRLLNWVTISVGDIPVHGQVRNMNWRTTQLQTRDNDIVSIPNSVLAKATVNNHATPSIATRMKLEFVLDARTRPRQARRVMRDAALRAAEAGLILDQPPPSVVITLIEDFGVRYRVMFYVNFNMASDAQALNTVAEHVLDALREAGVELAFRNTAIVVGTAPAVDASARPGDMAASKVVRLPPHGSPADERPPLSAEEIERIRASWARVKPLGERAAAMVFNRLFEVAPHLRGLFRSDARAQRAKLMAMLTMLVKGLDRPEVLFESVADLGLRHRSYGVRAADYEPFGAAFLWTLDRVLGEALEPATRAAWAKLYGVMADAMVGASGDQAA